MNKFYVLQIFAILLLFFSFQNICQGKAKFTNIKCQNKDINFAKFTICRLRAVKRDVIELSIKVELLHLPVLQPIMRWQLLKKASGYKPFLYDVTLDVCEYLEKHNHPFVNIIMNSFGNYSSGITRCPLKGDISLLEFRFPEKSLNQSLPLPSGEYAIYATFTAQEIERAMVQVYFMLEEF